MFPDGTTLWIVLRGMSPRDLLSQRLWWSDRRMTRLPIYGCLPMTDGSRNTSPGGFV